MGKPYLNELALLSTTYLWAKSYDLHKLSTLVQAASESPLTAVGSGGSLSAAAFVAMLHEHFTGMPAKHATPLEATECNSLRHTAVMLLSAKGSNPDIMQACRILACREPKALTGLVLKKGSHLARLRSQFPWIALEEPDTPLGKDGFLATNSLLAMYVLMYRAYCLAFGLNPGLPTELPEASISVDERHADDFETIHRGTICSLFSGWATAPAIDFESKLAEGGLLPVLQSDYRNFAHGRHNWLAMHPKATTVVALVTPENKKIAHRTLSVLPDNIPTITLEASAGGPLGAIELIVAVIKYVGRIGHLLGADVGKPNVADFGRTLYHQGLGPQTGSRSVSPDLIMRRKLGENLPSWPADLIESTRRSLAEWLEVLAKTTLGGLVLDYDGTLCPPEARFGSLPGQPATLLNALLEKGLLIGVATGRGESVRSSLREAIHVQHWSSVLVGYHNGAEVMDLVDSRVLDANAIREEIDGVLDLLRSDPLISGACQIHASSTQISLAPQTGIPLAVLFDLAAETVAANGRTDMQTVLSDHSVDILASGVSKLAVKTQLAERLRRLGRSTDILCIGDKATRDGNDFGLLCSPLGLSVDEVARSLKSAWHIAPCGHRGLQATMDYLRAVRPRGGGFEFDITLVGGSKLARGIG